MGVARKQFTDEQQRWIREQPMFFVATAPHDGRVNLSPKGYDSLRVIDEVTVAYLDLTGSGAETIAHVNENGRITFMWCAFAGKPSIVRAYGEATVFAKGSAGFDERSGLFPDLTGARSIIEAKLDRVSSSCGYGVPELSLDAQRPTLQEWAERKGEAGINEYQADKNQVSIDGLPTNLN